MEDNDDNVYVVKSRLTRAGFTVLIATDGEQGVAMAADERPDLILMDLSLPVLDGWEAVRRIKAAPQSMHIPVIALTAHAMPGDREKAMAAGCDDFDTKPVDLKRLLEKIRALMPIVRSVNAAHVALLVVDDNEDNRYTLTRRLRREGYANLLTANDGKQALEVLRSQHVDLVLLDIAMPELNGYQVLEQLKHDSALRDIPVIMISAVDELDSVVRCIELGAEDYLAKPFNPTLLRARVGASLEKKRLRDEVRESLQRLEREMDAARRLQLGMLPRRFPEWSPERPVRLHAFMEPAREVGGDLYDFFFPCEGVFCFLVGDVSGKGAPAALFMARTRSLVRLAAELCQRFARDHCTPASIAQIVNQELCQDNVDRMFVTLFLGFLDTARGTVAYVNAGHPAPYVSSASGAVDRIRAKPQVPLGVRSALVYDAHTIQLQPGDAMFLCTDGIADATNADEAFYTEARIESALRVARGDTPADMVSRVKTDVDRFTGDAPKADDMTMLALRWDPAQRAQ